MYGDAACHSRLAAVSEVNFCPAFHPLSTPFWISAALLCPFGLGFYTVSLQIRLTPLKGLSTLCPARFCWSELAGLSPPAVTKTVHAASVFFSTYSSNGLVTKASGARLEFSLALAVVAVKVLKTTDRVIYHRMGGWWGGVDCDSFTAKHRFGEGGVGGGV